MKQNELLLPSTMRMKPSVLHILFFAISLNLLAKETLVITGSSTIAPVISDLAKAYEKKYRNVRIDVQTGGSSRGILDVRKGLSHIGLVSRSLKKSESDLTPYTFAKDGLAIIVHHSNPVDELSEAQIQKIYTGEVRNWISVGAYDREIVVVNKAEGRSTLELFLHFFKLKNSDINADIVIGDNEQGIKTVSKNPNAIAYVSVGTAEYNKSVGVPLRLVKFHGVEAKVENVEKGNYPLMRELNLVIKGVPSKAAAGFIEYILSTEAYKIIKDHYFVPFRQI